MTDKPIADLTGKYPDMDHYVSIPVAELNDLRTENERLREDNAVIMAADKATQADNQRLRAVLEKIASDYYHDQHAIWAAETLTRMAEP